LLVSLLLALNGCGTTSTDSLTVTVVADGSARVIMASPAATVYDILRQAGISLGELDQVNPPGYTRILDGMTITVVRVAEELAVVQETVPFERLTTLNDSLPAGESRLLQAGVNGVAEVTYRITYQDGKEVSRTEVRRVLITPPRNEVIMVGSQGTLPTVTVNGTLVYISGGNAWIMRQNSANRRPLTLDGGLDGRVFQLSQDGKRLLFTRSLTQVSAEQGGLATASPDSTPTGQGPFNTLWAIFDTTDPTSEPVRLDLNNILYADWVPGAERAIIYSTAEPRPSFPGWQANNDLWYAQISANGAVTRETLLLEPSSGGIYGWYGTTFAFSPDGATIGWAQPDAVGVLLPTEAVSSSGEGETASESEEVVTPTAPLPTAYERLTLLSFAPRNAYDFVWRPSLGWSPDGRILATTSHGPPVGAEAPEDSPVFNLTVLPIQGGYTVDVVSQAGMWASPQFSPVISTEDAPQEYSLAFFQAVQPLNSVVSQYRLVVMDRDGSNRRVIFPPQDKPGLRPSDIWPPIWSPDGRQIALIYQGNLYLVDVITGLAQQLTQDGLSSSPRWTP
jgi:hypothetical protein